MNRRFTVSEFEAYVRPLRASADAICRSVWAATGPSRKTRSDAYHGSGRVADAKAGRTREAESRREFLIYRLFGFRKDVLWYAAQPAEKVRRTFMTVRDGRTYTASADSTADAFVLWRDRVPGWVEIKTRAAIDKAIEEHPALYVIDPDGTVRCPTADAFAAERGLSYTVIVIDNLDPVELDNAAYAEAFLGLTVPAKVLDDLRAFVARRGRVTLARLREAGFLVDHVIAAAFQCEVYIDFRRQPLREQHLVWVYLDPTVAAELPEPVVVSVGGARPGPVHLAAGEEVLHNGERCVIDAVSASTVRLAPAEGDGRCVTISRLDAEGAAASGALVGLGPADASRRSNLERIEALFAGASPAALERAEERLDCLRAYGDGERLNFPLVGGKAVTVAAVRAWQTEYRRFAELGCAFAGLIERPQVGRPGSHLLPETQALLAKVAEDFYLDPGRTPTVAALHRAVLGRAAQLKAEGTVVAAPSYTAVITWVDHQDIYRTLFRREGHRGAAAIRPWARFDPDAASPNGQFPGDVCHGDATVADITCPERFTREGDLRPTQFRLVDGYTGKKMGQAWCFGHVDEGVVLEALKDQIRRFGFLAAVYVLDNALEGKSTRVQQFLARYGSHALYRRKADGRGGLPVEREFGAINTDSLHNFRGNTRIARNVRSMDPSLAPGLRATWPLGELAAAVDRRDAAVEAGRHVAALRMTTDDAWDRRHEHGLREARLLRWSSALERELAVRHSYTPKVNPVSGIWVNRLYYWHDSFDHPAIEGLELKVLTLRADVGRVWAYVPQHTHEGAQVPGEWVECHTRSSIGRERVTLAELGYFSKVVLAYDAGHYKRKKIMNGELGALLVSELDHETVLQEETRRTRERNGRTADALPKLPRGDILADAPEPDAAAAAAAPRLTLVAGGAPASTAASTTGAAPTTPGPAAALPGRRDRSAAVAAAFNARAGGA